MNKEQPSRFPANIPVPMEAFIIAEVLKGKDPDTEVYVVGGAVRDWLYWKFRTDHSMSYKTKDVDLATNLSEEEILLRLQTPEARRFYIKVKEKESVDTFGVVFVSVAGKGPYEVAPFRKDVGSADGRRPEKVEQGTIHDDAARRDLTMNSLYYDMKKKEILDFNPNAQGIEDVKSGNVRTVGDPEQRFEEDKLRILRMVRFFSRYNSGSIVPSLDYPTMQAVRKYKDLLSFKGMSLERIQTEFLAGIAQCMNMNAYLSNYYDLELFPAVFPGCKVDIGAIGVLKDYTLNNPRVVLALLLHQNENVWECMNRLKYPNSLSDPVQFLVDAMKFDPENAVDVIKARDKRLIRSNKRELTEIESCINSNTVADTHQDLHELCFLLSDKDKRRCAILEHLTMFYHEPASGEELMKQGFKGPEIGQRQRAEIQARYTESLNLFLSTSKWLEGV